MRDGGHGHAEQPRNIPYAPLFCKEGVENFDSGAIPKNFIELCQVIQKLRIGRQLLRQRDGGEIMVVHSGTLLYH